MKKDCARHRFSAREAFHAQLADRRGRSQRYTDGRFCQVPGSTRGRNAI